MAVRSPADPALDLFHPVVQEWFAEEVGTPTDVQRLAWPEIAAGRHVLVTAPTGTGKTLTAFLWALNRFFIGDLETGATRVLYVSPLKALNTDVRRNLDEPLAALSARFRAAGLDAPAIRALTRSGDTPSSERQKMVRRPPEILITTPESLNILLTSEGGRTLLAGIETVILDEIHAVAGSKRGTHLITAVERLARLAGEFQRIALSATVRPLATVADLVGGFEMVPAAGGGWTYRKRPVTTVRSESQKVYDLAVRFPGPGDPSAPPATEDPETSVWDLLVPEIRKTIRRNRSTLVFANSRRTTEKLTRMINSGEEGDLAYSHHGSLSREVRQVVEERLKRGELPAIVATSSLELGIDVGALDEVVLVQTPFSVASTLQRIGRAGHRVGEVSRGTLLPLFGRDFLQAAVVARAVLDREIEALRPPENPLDVLAQVVLSMTAGETWDLEDLYAAVRAAWPYRNLPRRHFDLVLEMLAGRYADSRIRELAPRLVIDRVTGTVRARRGSERLVYMSGGTIPDRGYYHLRTEVGPGGEAGARLGELDEEFVWERSVGDTFTLGTRLWRIRKITHNDVIVEPARGAAAMAPFWRADARDREYFLSERVGSFLEAVEPRLDEEDEPLLAALRAELPLDRGAAAELVRLLRAQKAALGGRLPHRHRLVVEHVAPDGADSGSGAASRVEGPDRRQVVLHTFWGGQVNRPLAIALSAAWEERFGTRPEVLHDDDCLMLTLPEALAGEDPLALVPPERVEDLLRRRLEATGFFGALFRQNAARALLLPRAGFRHRMPLWVTRQRAKRLLEAVGRYGDFPLVLETWRSCLEDELDVPTLKRLLEEVRAGEVEVRHVVTEAPSPFAANLVWRQTNTLMYADDAPEAEGLRDGSGLRRDLLRELVFSSSLRPRIPEPVVEELRVKLQRVAPGYAPRSPAELLDWLRERLVVPAEEWRELVAAVERDRGRGGEEGDVVAELVERAAVVTLSGAAGPSVVALETLPRLAAALGVDLSSTGSHPRPRGVGADLASARASAGLDGGPGTGGDKLLPYTRSARGATIGSGSELHLASLVDPEAAAPEGALANLATILEAPQAPGAEEEADRAGDPLADLLGEWLRFYGPVDRERIAAVFGLEEELLVEVLEVLVDDQRVVVDELVAGAGRAQVCDAINLETLLRWTRAAARPAFEPLPLARLPLFLAAHQGLVPPGESLEGLQERLEALFALPLPARAWEAEVLPARLEPYRSAWLDTLMRESELAWTGVGEGKVAFVFPSDLELLRDSPLTPALSPRGEREMGQGEERMGGGEGEGELFGVDDLFPDRRGRFSLGDLADHSGLGTAEVAARLWDLAWQGRVSNDAFDTVRKGVLRKFRPAADAPSEAPAADLRGARRRGAFGRWRTARSFTGHWYVLPEPAAADGDDRGLDALEREELAKDRARLVLGRYGVVFRELLAREAPAFQWGRLFRALRLMELSGEVLAGQFFLGVPGLQFATPAAFRRLRDGRLPDDAVWWLNAADPASLAGADLPELKEALPERRDGNHVVFHGERPVLLSRRRGRSLEIHAAPDHPRLPDYLAFLKVQLTRDFAPRKSIEVEEVNGEPAPESPYRERLRELFSATVEPRSIKLRRRY